MATTFHFLDIFGHVRGSSRCPGMSSPIMVMKVTALAEGLIAEGTEIGLFSRVCSLVLSQRTGLGEALVTNVTHIALLSCVSEPVGL